MKDQLTGSDIKLEACRVAPAGDSPNQEQDMLEVNYTLRIDQNSRDRFKNAVKTKERHRKPSQVMRELMDAYADGRLVIEPSGPAKPSEDELRLRREAVEYAHSSVALEGFAVSRAAQDLAQRFMRGEISKEEFMAPSFDVVHGR
ncbi:antitoxin VbhA family protein [Xanthomonas citri]|uniref:antitoxin VbhA family protein n=1 Tax=Xanthomonas citri TaxID=346 RepID=UPI001D04A9A9|nr:MULTISPECIES: antitoxin VbhA family protein [Xanthomonas]